MRSRLRTYRGRKINLEFAIQVQCKIKTDSSVWLLWVSKRTIEDIEVRGDCRISPAYALCKALNRTLDDFYKEDAGE